MKIWNIKVSEPVPWISEESDQRLFRAGIFDQALREAGHHTLWFSNTFAHRTKSQRSVVANKVVRPHPDGPEMIFLESPGYRSNISFARFYDHWKQARAWRLLAPKMPKPDLILCAYPTIDLCAAAVEYGMQNKVPVVIDVRDLWPDVIYDRFGNIPIVGKVAGKRWLIPYERMANYALKNATALTGVGHGMVEWAQKRVSRSEIACSRDKHIYQSQNDPVSTAREGDELKQYWIAKGVDIDAKVVRIVWAGGLFQSIDAGTLFDALKLLPKSLRQNLEIVICGRGPLRPVYEAATKNLPMLKLVDWVLPEQLMGLLLRSHAGLLNYYNRFDFQRSIPNKVVDYATAGLPIITGVQGELTKLAGNSGAVVPYRVGDADSLVAAIRYVHARSTPGKHVFGPARHLYDENFEARRVMKTFTTFIEDLATRGGLQ